MVQRKNNIALMTKEDFELKNISEVESVKKFISKSFNNNPSTYETIAIIGLGTIGGFLSKNLSEIETVKKLVLVDYDKVETSNLENSIYKKSDVGKFKVDSISSVIKKFNNELDIISINKKYIEGKTKLPKCDLVIDCRDFIYDRGPEIDIRLYISSRYLIVDCRKDATYQMHHEGKYIDKLTGPDINIATFNLANLMHTSELNTIIKKNLLYKIELDFLKYTTDESIMEYENKKDIIIDKHKGDEKFLNFFETSEQILDKNKRYPVKLCLGSADNPISTKTIPMNEILTENELMKHCLTLTKKSNYSNSFNHYIVSPKIINKQYYVILIPETGAA